MCPNAVNVIQDVWLNCNWRRYWRLSNRLFCLEKQQKNTSYWASKLNTTFQLLHHNNHQVHTVTGFAKIEKYRSRTVFKTPRCKLLVQYRVHIPGNSVGIPFVRAMSGMFYASVKNTYQNTYKGNHVLNQAPNQFEHAFVTASFYQITLTYIMVSW